MSKQQSKSCDWWSETPQERCNGKDKEESLMDHRWNRSLSNKNDMSEEEEVTEILERTKNIISGSRKK